MSSTTSTNSKTVIDVLYTVYLEQRGRFVRHQEISGYPMTREEVQEIADKYEPWDMEPMLWELHLCDKARNSLRVSRG